MVRLADGAKVAALRLIPIVIDFAEDAAAVGRRHLRMACLASVERLSMGTGFSFVVICKIVPGRNYMVRHDTGDRGGPVIRLEPPSPPPHHLIGIGYRYDFPWRRSHGYTPTARLRATLSLAMQSGGLLCPCPMDSTLKVELLHEHGCGTPLVVAIFAV